MKKQLSIFFLFVFFFSQFGKVVNYCYCTIATYQQTGTIVCDCEKKLAVTETDTKKQDHQHNAILPHAEELFHLDNSITYSFAYHFQPAKQFCCSHEALYNAWAGSIFHPPGAAAVI